MFPIVKFNAVNEFLSELLGDSFLIDGGIVRVTRQTARRGSFPMLHITVIATAIIRPRDPAVGDLPRVVRLEKFCGDMFTTDVPEASPIWQKSDEVIAKVENAVRERGLTVRPGIIEVPTQQGSQT